MEPSSGDATVESSEQVLPSSSGAERESSGSRPAPPILDSELRQTADGKARSSIRKYWHRLHQPLIVGLFVICGGCALAGYLLRPAGADPPATAKLAPFVTFGAYQGSPRSVLHNANINVDETLLQTPDGASLEMSFSGSFPTASPVTWSLLLGTPGNLSLTLPHLCPDVPAEATLRDPINSATFTDAVASGYFGRAIPVAQPDSLMISGHRPGRVAAGVSGLIADVAVCWTANAPIEKRAQYLSATIPLVDIDPLSDPGARGKINATIIPWDGTDKYSVQAGTLPTTTAFGKWKWENANGFFEGLTAIDFAESQADAYHGFLSGVFLGVTGGALIGLITELLEPIRGTAAKPKPSARSSKPSPPTENELTIQGTSEEIGVVRRRGGSP